VAKVAAPKPQAVAASYPTRGGHWTHSDPDLIHHLQTHGNHAADFRGVDLSKFSREELEAMHSDDHEGRLKRQYLAPTTTRVPVTTARATQTSAYCPSGRCPNVSASGGLFSGRLFGRR
jgi:hypothetical protein